MGCWSWSAALCSDPPFMPHSSRVTRKSPLHIYWQGEALARSAVPSASPPVQSDLDMWWRWRCRWRCWNAGVAALKYKKKHFRFNAGSKHTIAILCVFGRAQQHHWVVFWVKKKKKWQTEIPTNIPTQSESDDQRTQTLYGWTSIIRLPLSGMKLKSD